MATIDALAGLAKARTKKTNVVGTCLGNVYDDYGNHPSIGPHAGQYPIAYNGWLYSTKQHPGDYNAPAGAPVYFGISPTRHDKNKAAGDVGISMGMSNGVAIGWFTDVTPGKQGIMTLKARAIQTQRPYMGWTGDFLGYTLVNLGTVPSGGGTPIPIPTPVVLTNESDEAMLLLHCKDNNGTTFYTLLDTANRVYDQVAAVSLTQVQVDKANQWADLYCTTKKATDIQAANLAGAITGYTKQTWPFPALPTGGTVVNNPPADVAAIATAVDAALADNFAAIPAAVKAVLPTKVTGTLS